jgi:Ca2+-binding RTX toxin-like protein
MAGLLEVGRFVMRSMLVIGVAALAAFAIAGAAMGGYDDIAKICQKDGWATAVDADGNPFTNGGDCVAYGARGGTVTECTVMGTNEADHSLQGTESDDVICGLAGDDSLIGPLGLDQVFFGGAGNDYVVPAPGEMASFAVGIFNGGDGNDGVEFVYGTFNGGNGNDGFAYNYGTFNGGAGNDDGFQMFSDAVFNGGDGIDGLESIYDNSTLNGGNGNDRVVSIVDDAVFNGGAGDDRLIGDAGDGFFGPNSATFNGGDGNDHANAVSAHAVFNGNAGDDDLTTLRSDGTFDGGAGSDTVCEVFYPATLLNTEIIGCT